jgi:sarcosine oxidase
MITGKLQVVASPCSGHGAKFSPLVGSLVADLVQGGRPHPRFAFRD